MSFRLGASLAALVVVALASPATADVLTGPPDPPAMEDGSAKQRAQAARTLARVARQLKVRKHQGLVLRDTYVVDGKLFARYGLTYRGVDVPQAYALVELMSGASFEVRARVHVPLPASLHIELRPKVNASAARAAVLAIVPSVDGEPSLVIRLRTTTELAKPRDGRTYWTSSDATEVATDYDLFYVVATPRGRFTVDAQTGVATKERKRRPRRGYYHRDAG